MKKDLSSYEKAMNEEIESRISQLEHENYDFGKLFGKKDWILVGTMVAAGIIIIIYGIY